MPDDVMMRLAQSLAEEIDSVVEDVLPELRGEVDTASAGDVIDDSDFRDSIATVLHEFVVILRGDVPSDHRPVDDVVRRRYAQGVSLMQLLHSYRVCAAAVWKHLSVMIRDDPAHRDALLAATPTIFERIDWVSLRAQEIYRVLSLARVRRSEQIRTALLDTLIAGDSSAGSDFWDAVAALEVPRRGRFVVVDVVAPSTVATATDWEDVAAAAPVVDRAWFRLGIRSQVGLVGLHNSSSVDDLGAVVVDRTGATVGVSAVFTSVTDCRTARTQAAVAAAATSPIRQVVRYDRDVLDVLMASAPGAAKQLVQNTFGQIVALPHEVAQPLIDMVEAWLVNGQSITATAAAQYCHRNTVKNRLKRFEELSGGSLTDNAWLGQVILAVRGYRSVQNTLPDRR